MATKRVGWGALLNSVKDKKQKKDQETSQDAPPAKKLKSEAKTDIPSKKEESKVVEKKEEKADKKGEKKKEAKEEKKVVQKTPKKEEKADKEGEKKIETKKVEKTPKKEEKADKKAEKKIDAKESKGEKTEVKPDKKATKETEVKSEKKTGEKKIAEKKTEEKKKTPAKEDKKESKETEVKEAKGEKKRKDREADTTKPTTNGKEATTTISKSKETKNKNKKSTKPETQKTEQEEKEEKHQLAKDAVRLALKDRPFFDFTKEEPIVVYLHPETKEGEHTFYLDLLAKSYLSNFSDSVSFRKTKLVLGFDIEFYRGLALTIQLSTASFSIVFNLHSSKSRKTELSPGLRHIFSSADYIKCGVGVPADMITLQGQFQISLSGMFDISWFVLDMGLTPGLWSLDTLGHDILGIGKVHGFGAKSYELNKEQIQYAARDGWLGYLLTDYFFDFFKQSNASIYSWTKAYVKKKDDALVRAVGEEKPFTGEQEDENEKEENEKDEKDEKDEKEKDNKEKDNKEKDKKEKDKKEEKGSQKGIRSRSTATIQSTTNTESRHVIRNKLEAIKATRRKANREEENFNNLIQQLSKIKEGKVAKKQKTEEAKQEEEEEEDVQVGGVIYNWV